ncbi:MAG: hypothetical protein ACI9J3_002085 [Parvicellaceae bacterium]|jgi:hypothetical protein
MKIFKYAILRDQKLVITQTYVSHHNKMSINYRNQESEQDVPKEFKIENSRIMFIEDKSQGLEGDARIGRVYFSKTKKTLYYRGQRFQSLKGRGFKANYFNIDTGDEFWISGPKKDQNDRLYGGNLNVEIDQEIKEEYLKIINFG